MVPQYKYIAICAHHMNHASRTTCVIHILIVIMSKRSHFYASCSHAEFLVRRPQRATRDELGGVLVFVPEGLAGCALLPVANPKFSLLTGCLLPAPAPLPVPNLPLPSDVGSLLLPSVALGRDGLLAPGCGKLGGAREGDLAVAP